VIDFVTTLVTVLLLFGATIFVHELGHFLVARWCGMVIETFSIGFGPALWKRKVGDVTYKIGVLPFGGYVALPQMDPAGADRAEEPQEPPPPPIPPASPWKRIAVAAAGAVFNLVFALGIAIAVHALAGPSGEGRAPVLGYVETNSTAYAEGLRAGDRILTVNGRTVGSWDDLIINSALADRVDLGLRTAGGAERTLSLPTEPIPGGGRTIAGIGKNSSCLIIGVTPGAPADEAGLRRRDVIVSFNGQPVYSVDQLIDSIRSHGDQDVVLSLLREGRPVDLTVRPRWNPGLKRVMIGIEFNRFDLSMKPMLQMWAWASPVFRILKAFATPKESRHAVDAVGGPVYIFKMYWMAAQTGFLLALWLTGMLNVNLAILNLLPIPVLDGGHISFALWEGLTHRPPGPKATALAHRIFAILLITLFALITARDIKRLVFGGGKPAAAPAAPATTNAAPQAP
jgi:regulator of sigma E protease